MIGKGFANRLVAALVKRGRRPAGHPRVKPGDRGPRPRLQDPERRRGAHLFGHHAESLAVIALRLKGYSILERRYAVSGGEIDLIARRGGVVAFVEVKARGDMDAAASAISATKRRRIARAARVWIVRNPWAFSLVLRGDAIFVAPWRLPRHARCAYRLEID